jgi:hypothetical protein
VSPFVPILTIGSSLWAFAFSALRSAGVSIGMNPAI